MTNPFRYFNSSPEVESASRVPRSAFANLMIVLLSAARETSAPTSAWFQGAINRARSTTSAASRKARRIVDCGDKGEHGQLTDACDGPQPVAGRRVEDLDPAPSRAVTIKGANLTEI
jgi:hypothetical protein